MIYRDAEDALRLRRDQLLGERRHELARLPHRTLRVYPTRVGRRLAGATGVASAVLLAAAAALRWHGLTDILRGSWLAIAGAYLVGRAWGSLRQAQVLARAFAPGDDAGDDLQRLEDETPTDVVARLAARAESGSVALPMIALSLLAPLSVHYLVITVLRLHAPATHEFDGWIALSLLIVGHSHVVLAYQSARFAHAARRTLDPLTLELLADHAAWRAWGGTIASSVIAGVLLMMVLPLAGFALLIIAPILVAATGMAVIPPMFVRYGRRLRNERLALAGLSCNLRPL